MFPARLPKKKEDGVAAFGEALKIKALSDDPNVLFFTNQIAGDNVDIPIIETDEKTILPDNMLTLIRPK